MKISKKLTIQHTCPLCFSEDLILLESISHKSLVRLYKKQLNLDVRKYIQADLTYYSCCNCNLGFFNPSPMGDSDFYEQLQANSWYYMNEKPEYDLVQDFIIKNVKGSLLEIGGGSGHFAKKMAEHVSYTGLEFNELAIQKAASNGITMICQSIEEHSNLYGNKYDCVVSFQVLEHILNPSLYIDSSINALKEGGYLIIAVPNKDGVTGLMPNIPLDIPPHHATHWRRSTLNYFENLFDLDVVKIISEDIAPQHNLVAKKYLFLKKYFPYLFENGRLIDNSFLYSILNLVSSLVARMMPYDADIFKNLQGHTIIAIFKKKCRGVVTQSAAM
jgi:2-polyprenyl-3-methyl-5-hydroxy-6-metoxy-1,4-benzoquinol methylase